MVLIRNVIIYSKINIKNLIILLRAVFSKCYALYHIIIVTNPLRLGDIFNRFRTYLKKIFSYKLYKTETYNLKTLMWNVLSNVYCLSSLSLSPSTSLNLISSDFNLWCNNKEIMYVSPNNLQDFRNRIAEYMIPITRNKLNRL